MHHRNRIRYTLSQGYKHYRAIARIQQTAINHLSEIDFLRLKASGIKTLVFDFDGILAAHGEGEVNPQGQLALQEALKHLDKVYILSNKPTLERKAYFKAQYPQIIFMCAEHKKPFPDGLEAIIQETKHAPNEVCLIDDRLLTGVLASIIADTQCLYISKPSINYKDNLLVESVFQALRFIERLVFWRPHS